MAEQDSSDTFYLLGFFVAVIAVGTLLLALPVSRADPTAGGLSIVDALFMSTSAVCVTGLTTVNTAELSRFGQLTILGLIQVGGLGIISFTSLLLLVPGARMPFRRRATIRGMSIEGVEHDPARIVRDIVAFTIGIEALGAVALGFLFSAAGVPDAPFAAAFHAVSAFCNAGFSVFPDNLNGYARNPGVLGVVAFLVVSGGIGFIVLQDIARRIRGARKGLSDHTRLVLGVTAFLVVGAAAAFWLLEGKGAFRGMNPVDRIANALFQAITPRTAGFDSVPQQNLSQPSKVLTIILMFIGGAPGSIAGGIKVSTAFLVLLVATRRANPYGEITAFRRRFTAESTGAAVTYCLKAACLLIAAAGALSLTEGLRGADFGSIVFESVSAFGTVGLSLGITGSLSVVGKLVIIGTMFAGRVGLVALAFPTKRTRASYIVRPEARVMIG